jgi:non-ribosomal peptide synthetase component F
MVSVVFNIDRPLGALDLHGLDATFVANPRSRESFDLVWNVAEQTDGLGLQCIYDADLFDAATTRRWLAQYEAVLRSVVADPAQEVAALAHEVGDAPSAETKPTKSEAEALKAPSTRDRVGDDFVAPATETEQRIAQIWRELLAIERISTSDNFFDLGGHSLLAATAMERIERELGHEFLPVELATQTLGQLAAACDNGVGLARKPNGPGFLRQVLGSIGTWLLS